METTLADWSKTASSSVDTSLPICLAATLLKCKLASAENGTESIRIVTPHLFLSTMNVTVLKPLAGIVRNCDVGLKTFVGVTVT